MVKETAGQEEFLLTTNIHFEKHKNITFSYDIKKRQLWDRGFRRNSYLQAEWDTSIARTTGFMWPRQEYNDYVAALVLHAMQHARYMV